MLFVLHKICISPAKLGKSDTMQFKKFKKILMSREINIRNEILWQVKF